MTGHFSRCIEFVFSFRIGLGNPQMTARAATPNAKRRNNSPIPQNRVNRIILFHADFAPHAQATSTRPFTTRVGSKDTSLYEKRHLALQRFDVVDRSNTAKVNVHKSAGSVVLLETAVTTCRYFDVDKTVLALLVVTANGIGERSAAKIT